VPLLSETPRAAAPFCYHCPLERTYPSCALACADDLEVVIAREGAGTIAAFIAEPILGASAGAARPPDDYTRRVRETCRRHGIVYIDDEVMTGSAAPAAGSGSIGAAPLRTSSPAARGLAGGYMPVGAVLASEAIVETVERKGGFVNGFTFSHHPVTAAAALATLEILERERLVERAAVVGERALARLRPCARALRSGTCADAA
jgi:adenosylmethionine-8-amino-7-oxononanoate aminotransferase